MDFVDSFKALRQFFSYFTDLSLSFIFLDAFNGYLQQNDIILMTNTFRVSLKYWFVT
jgi:hypothetical protein